MWNSLPSNSRSVASPERCPPFISTASAPWANRLSAAALMSVKSFILQPRSCSASGIFGVSRLHSGIIPLTNAPSAELCISSVPAVAAIMGSHTTISGWYFNIADCTARIVPTSGSIPIFTALTVISENTASSCAEIISGGTVMLVMTFSVFSATTEVITLMP